VRGRMEKRNGSGKRIAHEAQEMEVETREWKDRRRRPMPSLREANERGYWNIASFRGQQPESKMMEQSKRRARNNGKGWNFFGNR
jgi:hypothetical protein